MTWLDIEEVKKEDDDDDFEEDDDENDEKTEDDDEDEVVQNENVAPKLKPSNAALLICSMKDTL